MSTARSDRDDRDAARGSIGPRPHPTAASAMRVLLAEDDIALAAVIARGLRRNALAVDVAHDGEAALDKARLVAYDVVVLDRELPGVHGDLVCRALHDDGSGPRILMLTASGSIEDRVEG